MDDETFPDRFGPFLLLDRLGSGGMGTAYLAHHPEASEFLVVKRLHRELLENRTAFSRFVHEAEAASHVSHPNVARLVAMGTVDEEPFLATEFVFGIPWSTLVRRVEASHIEPVPLGVALHMALELAHGVRAIHEAKHRESGQHLGLIHRDIGSRNVLIGFDGRVRLIDLGLGKSILAGWKTEQHALAGSPDYMAPEQAMGGSTDARADLYAAAVTIWELFAGRKRIVEDRVEARIVRALSAQPEVLLVHRPDAPASLERALVRAMAFELTHRTPDMATLERELSEVAGTTKKRASREEVAAWLDSSCATLIAKQRRWLEDLRTTSFTRPAPPRSATHFYFGEEKRAIRPASARARGAGRRRPRRAILVASAMAVFGLVAWFVTGNDGKPDEAVREIDAGGEHRPFAPGNESMRRDIDGVDVGTVDEKSSETSRAASSLASHEKAALVRRVQRLRRVRWDVAWQRDMTRLSAHISDARADGELRSIARDLAKLEAENGVVEDGDSPVRR